jgi:hypothetical protein
MRLTLTPGGTCPTVLARFNDHRRQPISRHGGIPHQERVLLRRRIGPELRQHKPAGRDFPLQPAVLRRIRPGDAGPNDRDSPAARIKSSPMRGGVYAACQARENRYLPLDELTGHASREP